VLKAMLLVAYLNQPQVRDRPLTVTDFRLIGPMIQRSDNAAATRVLGIVGPAAVYSVARSARMHRFELVTGIWGRSQIDAYDQSRFFLHVDSRVVPRHRATALHLLSSIVPEQRWGIGRLSFPGWQVYFKGGWGDGSGAVDHQVALLRRGHRRVSVAVLDHQQPEPRVRQGDPPGSLRAAPARSLRDEQAAADAAPLRHLHQRLADLAARAVLGHEAVHARVVLGGAVGGVPVGAHQNEPCLELGVALAQQRADGGPGHPGHAHVDQRNVGPQRLDHRERLVPALRNGGQVQTAVAGDGPREPVAVGALIVSQNHREWTWYLHRTWMVPPRPGTPYPLPGGTSAVWPSSRCRSAIRMR
jgi:Beta-lactamase enzyme family